MTKYLLTTIFLWNILCSVTLAQSPVATPVPGMDPFPAPPMPANPSPADYGAEVYWITCMACHGDKGQGLTEEFRVRWGEEEQNCWQSKCHASNHPPEGFKLPTYAPPIIGDGVLNHYQADDALYNYISARMPWPAPGSLSETEYRQLTAFLLRANQLSQSSTTVAIQREALTASNSVQWPIFPIALALLLPLLAVGRLGR